MSRTIDEKIVEMRFDNKDFEKNVSESMSTLDKLKNALNFSGIENAFSGMSSAADKVNFGGLTGALDDVSSKFSALETVAIGALMNIGAKVSDLAMQTAKELTIDQITSGFDKYATKSKAVQTIMNATGEEIGEVSKQLEKLNWYTDETSYDFAEMVTTIGKFTANGVDLETSLKAMEGIANWAGVSGADKNKANMAFYNLAQALSLGYVGVADWRSIMNAGMDTQEFRQMAIEEAIRQGTLAWDEDLQAYVAINRETQEVIYENQKEGKKLIVNQDNFYKTLTKGHWFDTSVLLETLDNYGRFSDKLNEFYNEINSQDGFDILTSELVDFVDSYRNGTIDMQEAMDATGLSADRLTEYLRTLSSAEYELSEKAYKASYEARTFQDAIDATKDAVSTQWMNTFEYLFGNYEEAVQMWTALSEELWDIFAGPISEMNDVLKEWKDLDIGGRTDFIQGIKNIYEALRSIVDPMKEAWDAVFPSIDKYGLAEIVTKFEDFTSKLILTEDAAGRVSSGFKGVFDVLKLVGDILGNAVNPFFSELLKIGDDLDGGFFAIFGQFGDWLSDIVDKVQKSEKFIDFMNRVQVAAADLGDALHKLLRPGDIVGLFEQFGGGISGASAVIIDAIQDIIQGIGAFAYLITGNGEVFTAVENINKKLDITIQKIQDVVDAFEGKFGKISEIFSPIIEAIKTIGKDFFEGLTEIFGGVGTAAEGAVDHLNAWLDVLEELIKTSPKLEAFMDSFKDGVQAVADFLTHVFSLKDAVQIFKDAGGGLEGLFAVIDERLIYVMDKLFDAIEKLTGYDAHYIGDNIVEGLHVIGEGILWLADLIATKFGWEDNPFGTMLESSSGALDRLKDKIANIFGSNAEDLSIEKIFSRIKDAVKSFWEFLETAAPKISGFLETIGKVVKWVFDQLSNLSLEDVVDLAKLATFLTLMTNISWVLGGFSEVLEAFALKIKAEALKDIGVAILEIAGAAMLLATIPEEKMSGVITALAVAFGGLIGTLFASKFASIQDVMKLPALVLSLSVALVAFAKSLEEMADAVAVFGQMDTGELIQGLVASLGTITVILLEFVAAVKVLSANGAGALTGAQAMREIATALLELGAALLIIDQVDHYWTSLFELAAALTAITLLTTLLSPCAAALAVFATSIEKLGKGLLFLSIAVGILGFLGTLLNDSIDQVLDAAIDFTVAVLDKLAERMPELVSSFANVAVAFVTELGNAFSDVDPTPFLNGAEALGIGIAAVVALKYLGPSGKDFIKAGATIIEVMLLFAEIVAVFAAIGYLIQKADEGGMDVMSHVESFSELATAISDIIFSKVGVLLAACGGLLLAFDKLGIGAPGAGALGSVIVVIGEVAAVIEAMGLIFGALGVLIDLIETANGGGAGYVVKKVNQFGEVAVAIADILGDIAGKFLGGVIGGITEGVIKGWTDGVSYLVREFSSIVDDFKAFDDDAINGAMSFTKLLLIITAEEVMVGISTLASFGLNLLGGAVLQGQMASFGKAVKGFVDEISELNTGSVEKASICASIVKTLAADIPPTSRGLLSWIWEDKRDLGVFGKQLPKLGEGLAAFQESTSTVSEETIRNAANCISIIAALSSEIPATTRSVLGWLIEDKKDFGVFGKQLPKLGEGLLYFNSYTENVSEDTVKNAANCISIIASLASEIPATTRSVLGWLIEDKKDFGVFGEQLPKLGEGLLHFNSYTENVSEDTVKNAANCISIIAALSSEIPATTRSVVGWILEDKKDLGVFGEQLPKLGEGLLYFNEYTKNINKDVVENAASCASAIAALASDIPVTTRSVVGWILEDKKDLGVFGEQLPKLGEGLLYFNAYTKSIDSGVITTAAVCAKAIAALASDIPATTRSVLGWILEDKKDLGVFGEQLPKLGEGLMYFNAYTKNIDVGVVTTATICARTLAELAADIPVTTGSWWDHLWKNDNSLSSFGSNLEAFGKGFKKYYDAICGIEPSTLKSLTQAISDTLDSFIKADDVNIDEKVKAIGDSIMNSITNMFKTQTTIEQAKNAGGMLIDYIADKFYEESSTTKISNAVSNLIGVAFDETGVINQLKTASTRLVEQIQSGISEKLESDSGPKAEFKKFLDVVLSIIDNNDRFRMFNDAGKKLLESVGTGLTHQNNTASVKTSFLNFITSLASDITAADKVNQFKTAGTTLGNAVISGLSSQQVAQSARSVGYNVGSGMAQGINESAYLVQQAARNLAYSAQSIVSSELQIRSPSVVMKLLGKFVGEGFANGIYESIPNVEDKVHSLGQSVLNGIKSVDIVGKMREIGLLGSGSLAEGLSSKLEALFNVGDLLSDTVDEGFLDDLFDHFSAGEDVQAYYQNGLTADLNGIYEAGKINGASALEGLASYGTGGANARETQNAAQDLVSLFGNSLQSSSNTVRNAAEYDASTAFEGLSSYGSGGSNSWKTQSAGQDFVSSWVSGVESSSSAAYAAGERIVDATWDGILGSNWNEYQNELANRFSVAMEGVSGYASDPWFLMDDSNLNKYNNEIQSYISTISDAMSSTTIQGPTITPVIDYDDFYKANNAVSSTQLSTKSIFIGPSYDSGTVSSSSAGSVSRNLATANQNLSENGPRWNEALNGNGSRWNEALTDEVRGLRSDMATYTDKVSNLQIVMDTGTVAGELTPSINKNLGTGWIMSGRGI